MHLEEYEVRKALNHLESQSLVRSVSASDSRVTKFEHRLQDAFNFYRPEIPIICELLLRGPQTPGELRTRASRMHAFEDLESVHSALERLAKREPPLVTLLPRQPGTKEARYAHLLSGDVETWYREPEPGPIVISGSSMGEQIARLEGDVAVLQREIADLKKQFADFRKQFE